MKLSKKAFEEVYTKCKARFPRRLGNSANFEVWQKFCAKNPVEFSGNINGVEVILRLSKDEYAVAFLNPCGMFEVFHFLKK